MKKILSLLLTFLLSFSLLSCTAIDGVLENLGLEDENVDIDYREEKQDKEDESQDENQNENPDQEDVEQDGSYTSKDEVALYIDTYDKLPKNYITKKKATELGWESSKGNLWDVTDEMSIGGDRFGNREKRLPEESGRQYYECDINYEGGYRGPERLVYSDDGLIYYTGDHYESFDLLYGEE